MDFSKAKQMNNNRSKIIETPSHIFVGFFLQARFNKIIAAITLPDCAQKFASLVVTMQRLCKFMFIF